MPAATPAAPLPSYMRARGDCGHAAHAALPAAPVPPRAAAPSTRLHPLQTTFPIPVRPRRATLPSPVRRVRPSERRVVGIEQVQALYGSE